MKEDNKYFVPEIEDLHIGYECEIIDYNDFKFADIFKSDKNTPIVYCKFIIQKHHLEPDLDGMSFITEIFDALEHNHLRTPYLTKEQIEAEGWDYIQVLKYLGLQKLNVKKHIEPNPLTFKKSNYFLVFREHLHKIAIMFFEPALEDSNMNIVPPESFNFECECKSINEFRYIQKLLKIK